MTVRARLKRDKIQHFGLRYDSGAGAPPRGEPAPLLATGTLRYLLAEDAPVSAPQLVVVDVPDRGAVREVTLGEPGQVLDQELRPRPVGRETVLRVGQHERVREVRVRPVDQRNVVMVKRGRRVVQVEDPDRPGRNATRLEADALVLDGGAGHTHAQAAVHAVRRVLGLERRVVHATRRAAVVAEL